MCILLRKYMFYKIFLCEICTFYICIYHFLLTICLPVFHSSSLMQRAFKFGNAKLTHFKIDKDYFKKADQCKYDKKDEVFQNQGKITHEYFGHFSYWGYHNCTPKFSLENSFRHARKSRNILWHSPFSFMISQKLRCQDVDYIDQTFSQ